MRRRLRQTWHVKLQYLSIHPSLCICSGRCIRLSTLMASWCAIWTSTPTNSTTWWAVATTARCASGTRGAPASRLWFYQTTRTGEQLPRPRSLTDYLCPGFQRFLALGELGRFAPSSPRARNLWKPGLAVCCAIPKLLTRKSPFGPRSVLMSEVSLDADTPCVYPFSCYLEWTARLASVCSRLYTLWISFQGVERSLQSFPRPAAAVLQQRQPRHPHQRRVALVRALWSPGRRGRGRRQTGTVSIPHPSFLSPLPPPLDEHAFLFSVVLPLFSYLLSNARCDTQLINRTNIVPTQALPCFRIELLENVSLCSSTYLCGQTVQKTLSEYTVSYPSALSLPALQLRARSQVHSIWELGPRFLHQWELSPRFIPSVRTQSQVHSISENSVPGSSISENSVPGSSSQHILLRRMIIVIICQTRLKWS